MSKKKLVDKEWTHWNLKKHWDAQHLLTAWKIADILELSTNDESLRELFKVTRQLNGRFRDLEGDKGLQLSFLNFKFTHEIDGLRSIIFKAPGGLSMDFDKGWKVLEKETAYMDMYSGNASDLIQLSCQERMVIESVITSWSSDDNMCELCQYTTYGVVHWEEKPGAIAQWIKGLKPMKKAATAATTFGSSFFEEGEEESGEMNQKRSQALKEFLDSGWAIDDPLFLLAGGDRLLEKASVDCQIESIDLLIQAGASLTKTKHEKQGLLSTLISRWSPCGAEQEDTLRHLLSAGVPVDEQDDNGMTALMLACEDGKPNMAQILLSAGADFSLKNQTGKDAFALSAQEPKSHRGQSCKPLLDAHLASQKINQIIQSISKDFLHKMSA